MIFNMVSERYPRDEDDDSAADFDSAIDEDLSHDVDMEVSESKVHSSLCNHICFGSFGSSDLSTIYSALIVSIQPTIDGFTIKIGEITCALIDSSCSIKTVSADSEDNVKSKDLECEFVVSEATEGLNELGVSAEIKKSHNLIKGRVQLHCGSVYGIAAIRPFASWFYVGKQKQHISRTAFNNQVWLFKLHGLCNTVFDPGGTNSFRSSLFTSNVFFLAMMLSLHYHSFKSSHFVFDPGGNQLISVLVNYYFDALIRCLY
jgi:hypothetical protein